VLNLLEINVFWRQAVAHDSGNYRLSKRLLTSMPSNYRDKNGKDPFSDEHGRNPFADDGQDLPATEADSPYAASTAKQSSYRPGDFETTLPHRGGFLLGLAIAGLLVAALGIPVWYYSSNPLGMVALAASVPAAVLAGRDLRAMKMGAMDTASRDKTHWALLVGLLGTAVALVSLVLWVGQLAMMYLAAMS
jgi:hypothetical protein